MTRLLLTKVTVVAVVFKCCCWHRHCL